MATNKEWLILIIQYTVTHGLDWEKGVDRSGQEKDN